MQSKYGICAGILAGCMFLGACGAKQQTEAEQEYVLETAEQENGLEEGVAAEDEIISGEEIVLEETEPEESLPGIICWGDSLTYGYNGEGVSYPSVLEQRIKENIGEIPVVNMGACGEDSITIAGRSGGIPFVTAEDITILAEPEAIEVAIVSQNGKEVSPSIYTDVGINECEIAGVSGMLTIQDAGQQGSRYIFVRAKAGEEVQVPSGTEIKTEASEKYKDYLSIVFVGTNGGYEDYDELIVQQDAIIASRTANTDKYLVVGITYGTEEGMAEYDKVMYEHYGDKYLCLRSYLSVFGMRDAGLTPTEEDRQRMQAGMVPLSLRTDDVHFTAKGYEVTGNVIYDKLESLGYFDAKEQILERKEAFAFAEELGAGINIGNSLDAYGRGEHETIGEYETSWHNPEITPELLALIKESGFETVRIPVTWQEHLREDGSIEPEWLMRVKEVVDYAYAQELYVIIDVHHDEWLYPSYENLYQAQNMIELLWTQIAECFREYDEHLIFEGMNEPRCKGMDWEWGNGTPEAYLVINQWNQCFVDAVRKAGGYNEERYLLITAYRSGGQEDMLNALLIPDDEHIMLSAHSYSPYSFAQDEDGTTEWKEEEEESVKNINYDFRCMAEFSSKKHIPVVLTEFGAVDKENPEDRTAWCEYMVGKAKKAGIPYIWWDNNYPAYPGEGYGILDRWNNVIAYPEILKILTDQ